MPQNFMGNNVGFMGPDADKQMEIQRRSALAQALQGQAMEPIQQQQSGGWTVPISPFQGLAKLAQGYVGGMAGNKAQELAKALQQEQQQRRGVDISLLVDKLRGRPASPGGLSEDASGNVTQMDPMAAQSPMQGLQQALPMMQDPQMQQALLPTLMQQMTSEPQRVDLGDRIGLVKNGAIVGYLPKGVTPDTSVREAGAQARHITPSGSSQLGAQTTLRGQDLSSETARRGQDIGAQTARVGQQVTMRGQDLSAQTAVRGQDITNARQVARTPGQEATDKEFAKEYVAFKAAGGIADINKQIEQLQEAANSLKTDSSLTGPVRGNLPDWVRAGTNPKAVATKEMVQEVAQRNLRLILGAQFTEKEGERLIARVYNDRLDPSENSKRVERLITQITEAARAKQDAADYFEQNGTLQGWQGKLFTLNDFMPRDRAADSEDPLGLRNANTR